MKLVLNPGNAFDFQHNGLFRTLPNGVSEWPDETAAHLQKKRGSLGVRVVTEAHVRAMAAAATAEVQPEPPAGADLPPATVPTADGSEGPPVASEPVAPPAEVQPEPPAAPIEGEQTDAPEHPEESKE